MNNDNLNILNKTNQNSHHTATSPQQSHNLQRKDSKIKNERGLFLVFFPIVLFGLISNTLDNFLDYSKFQDVQGYFKRLYSTRFIIFVFLVISWSHAKKIISGHIMLTIYYVFNILAVLSDICNIREFYQHYEQYSDGNYYKTLYLKNAVNYFFLICWTVIFCINVKLWLSINIEEEDIGSREEKRDSEIVR